MPEEYDVCACGDYRHQHFMGGGPCLMPNTMSHGFKPCESFRLRETCIWRWEPVAEVSNV